DAGGDERVDETAEQDGQSLSGEFPIRHQSPPPWPGKGFLARSAPSPAAECEARRSLRRACSRAARRACRRSVLEFGRLRPRRAVALRSRRFMSSWSSQAMTKEMMSPMGKEKYVSFVDWRSWSIFSVRSWRVMNETTAEPLSSWMRSVASEGII